MLTIHHSLLTTHHPPPTTYHPPLITYRSPLTTHHSPLAIASLDRMHKDVTFTASRVDKLASRLDASVNSLEAFNLVSLHTLLRRWLAHRPHAYRMHTLPLHTDRCTTYCSPPAAGYCSLLCTTYPPLTTCCCLLSTGVHYILTAYHVLLLTIYCCSLPAHCLPHAADHYLRLSHCSLPAHCLLLAYCRRQLESCRSWRAKSRRKCWTSLERAWTKGDSLLPTCHTLLATHYPLLVTHH